MGRGALLLLRLEKLTISENPDQWRCLRDNAADPPPGNAVALECCQRGIGVRRRDGDEETARGLRIEEKVLIFSRDARFEFGAFSDERTIVF